MRDLMREYVIKVQRPGGIIGAPDIVIHNVQKVDGLSMSLAMKSGAATDDGTLTLFNLGEATANAFVATTTSSPYQLPLVKIYVGYRGDLTNVLANPAYEGNLVFEGQVWKYDVAQEGSDFKYTFTLNAGIWTKQKAIKLEFPKGAPVSCAAAANALIAQSKQYTGEALKIAPDAAGIISSCPSMATQFSDITGYSTTGTFDKILTCICDATGKETRWTYSKGHIAFTSSDSTFTKADKIVVDNKNGSLLSYPRSIFFGANVMTAGQKDRFYQFKCMVDASIYRSKEMVASFTGYTGFANAISTTTGRVHEYELFFSTYNNQHYMNVTVDTLIGSPVVVSQSETAGKLKPA